MSEVEFYTSNATDLYVQKGPGRETHYLGLCYTADSLPDVRAGRDAVICVDESGNLSVIGKKQTAPGLATFDVERLLMKSASWLERLHCPFTLFALQNCTGKKGTFLGWERAQAITKVEYTGGPVNNAAQRDSDDEITVSASYVANPVRMDWFEIHSGQKTTAEDQIANTIDVLLKLDCGGRCSEMYEPGEIQVIGYVSDAGVAAANVEVSTDYGDSWTASAQQPFLVDEEIVSIRMVQIDGDTIRTIALRDTKAAVALEIAWHDDYGATAWNTVALGATAAEAGIRDQSMFVLDASNIWVVTDLGRAYKSEDGGLTWTEQTSALVASGAAALHCVHFYNENLGIAAGAGDVIIKTTDGGVNWAAATATSGGGDIYTIGFVEPYTLVCGDDDGNVWLSFDQSGSAWEVLTAQEYADAGTGAVNNIKVVNAQSIFLAGIGTTNAYIYRSVNGGRNFERITGQTLTSQLNAVAPIDPNFVMAVGDDDGTIAVILGAGKSGA